MKLLRVVSIIGLAFTIVSFHGVASAQSNCNIVNVSPGIFEFPSSGGIGTVFVFVDSGCSWSAACFGFAISSGGGSGIGPGGFGFLTTTNPGPQAITGQCNVAAGLAGGAFVNVIVDPPAPPKLTWWPAIQQLLQD